MNKMKNHRTEKFRMGWRMLALCGAVLLCLWAVPAQALVVTIDLGWGYNDGWADDAAAEAGLLSGYNLQEGSIVQVIMYDSASANAPGTEADDNFDIWGDYSGDDLYADPYTSGAENIPDDQTLYDPESVVPSGHVLAYTTAIGDSIADAGGQWYNIYEQFEILGTYDSLYIRVFGATEFPNGAVIASYWGLSDVETTNSVIDTWFVDPIDNTVASQTNYFEVIPEPGTMALFLLGGTGLLAGVRRRQKRS